MPGPLNGLKILDFTTLLPGPYATMILADMGAEVLRVLSDSYPDMATSCPLFFPTAIYPATLPTWEEENAA